MSEQDKCPICTSLLIERSLEGGLFSDRCFQCGWERWGTYSPVIDGMAEAKPAYLSVTWPDTILSGRAIKILRDTFPLTKKMSLLQLSSLLADGKSLSLGTVNEYALENILTSLSNAGFVVSVIPSR